MGNNRKLQFAIRAALAAAAASASVPIALSQTVATATTAGTATDTTLQEVVVTGSRLQQSPNDISISPVTSVTALDIQQTGLVRAEDILNNLPQVIAEQSSGTSISSNGSLPGFSSSAAVISGLLRTMTPPVLGAVLGSTSNFSPE